MFTGKWPKQSKSTKQNIVEMWRVAGANILTSFKTKRTNIAIIPRNITARTSILDKILGDDDVWLATENYAIYCCEKEVLLDNKNRPEKMTETSWKLMWWDKQKLVSYTRISEKSFAVRTFFTTYVGTCTESTPETQECDRVEEVSTHGHRKETSSGGSAP